MKKPYPNISLKDLQTWMKWIITDPRGVEKALSNPRPHLSNLGERYIEPSPSARNFIATSSDLSVNDRLSIYAEAYFARIVEALEVDFARTRLVLGEFRFQKLTNDYLKTYPSKTFNLSEVGRSLPLFISQYNGVADIPFLSELAQFEWRIVEAFYAQEANILDALKLQEIGEEDWPFVILEHHPSIQIISSQWPLHLFWHIENNNTIDVSNAITPGKEAFYLLWRQQGNVRFRNLSSLEALALKCMKKGLCLAEVLEKIATCATDMNPDELSSNIMNLFDQWMKDHLITNLHIKGNIYGKSQTHLFQYDCTT